MSPRRSCYILLTFIVGWIGFVSVALADVQVEGRGEVQYETGLFSSKPDEASRQQALAEARKNALERYTSDFSTAKNTLFQKISSQVFSNIDQYVIDSTVVDEGTDKDTKTYYIVVRASIDDAKLDALLNAQGIADAQTAIGGHPAVITYLFVARTTASVKTFDIRRAVRAENDSNVSGSQDQGLAGGSANYNETSSTTQQTTTGGSSLQKSDEMTYQVTSPEELNAAMSDVLSSNNFQVYDYRDVVSQCGGVDPTQIYSEFSNSNELSRETRNSAFAAARQCSIGYFAIGTLDVGIAHTDPVTGNQQVYVVVRSQLLDISGRLPRIVASVGPVQYAGLGPDPTVAERNALQLAAHEVGTEISDRLNAAGIH